MNVQLFCDCSRSCVCQCTKYTDCFSLPSEPARSDPNLHVADIKPPGQIKTVEVEVEPVAEDSPADKREGEGEGERKEATTPESQPQEVERDGRPGETSGADEPTGDKSEPQPSQATPTATPPPPPPASTTEQSGDTRVPPPSTKTPPTVPPPLDTQGPQSAERPDSFGLNHPSPITRLPPLMSPTDDLSGQRSPAGGGKKKSAKPKALSNKDLLACHQDVARSNRELVEPSTPEFKPTPEWVRERERECVITHEV